MDWFDVSMLYVRVMNCQPTTLGIPETLIMRFSPREISVCMEVNGARIAPSEEVSLVLRCSRHVKNNPDPQDALADIMYVSTDHLRTSSTLEFQILEQGSDSATLIVSGSLEKKPEENFTIRPKAEWVMVSSCEIGVDGCAFIRAKHEIFKHASMGTVSAIPSVAGTAMEICAVGRFMGEPMILTQTVPLKRRHIFTSSCITLNAIPEDIEIDRPVHNVMDTTTMASLDFFEEAGEVSFFDMLRSSQGDLASKASANFKNKAQLMKFDSSSMYMTSVNQEERWYKRGISTGIKVGLGIGIGMCIGVGIGLGLIIHKFRSTTNSLKKIAL